MKQIFKVVSIVLFAITIILSVLALLEEINPNIPLISLLISVLLFYFYIFIDSLEPDNYKSQDNWYKQLEDEESDYNYYPDRD